MLDDGAVVDSAESSFINSETSDAQYDHEMSASVSEGSDDLDVDMKPWLLWKKETFVPINRH